ncbi:magnesium transporter [bacterium]|nr:magnesium transporter [bacterium]
MTPSPVEHNPLPFTPDRWLELVEIGSNDEMRSELTGRHPADIAAVLEQIPFELQLQLFKLLDTEVIPQVVAELDEHDQARLIGKLQPGEIADIIEKQHSDDAADLLGILEDEHAAAVLDNLSDEDREELTELMSYDEESAGGIMTKEALSISMDASVEDTIDLLRKKASEIGDIYYTYIVNSAGKLKGYVSLKRLILAQPDQPVNEIMKTDIVQINVDMDREEVTVLFRKYDLASAPVVNEEGRFLGRITHDDIIDVIDEEADEDLAYLTGQAEFDPGERSLFRNLKHRLPWMMLGLLGGLIGARVIAYFEPQFSKLSALVFYLPLIAAMGGNAGIQTSSLMVRGLATGEIGSFGMKTRLLRELGIALLTGIACAGTLLLITWLWQGDLYFSFVVSISLLIVITFAATVGVLVPLALDKSKMDPALATGPFITTTSDIIGLLIYLGIAAFFLTY